MKQFGVVTIISFIISHLHGIFYEIFSKRKMAKCNQNKINENEIYIYIYITTKLLKN